MRTGQLAARVTGGCLCGAVRYQVTGPLRDVVSCHCTHCRRTSGHFVAATAARSSDVVLLEESGLRWYTASNKTRRGFCDRCGSSLFWEPAEGGHTSIMAGTLDGETGLKTVRHICVETAGDYYRIGDGVPQIQGDDHGVAIPAA